MLEVLYHRVEPCARFVLGPAILQEPRRLEGLPCKPHERRRPRVSIMLGFLREQHGQRHADPVRGIPRLRIEASIAPEEHVSPMVRGSFDFDQRRVRTALSQIEGGPDLEHVLDVLTHNPRDDRKIAQRRRVL
jgi:hypothetical protein